MITFVKGGVRPHRKSLENAVVDALGGLRDSNCFTIRELLSIILDRQKTKYGKIKWHAPSTSEVASVICRMRRAGKIVIVNNIGLEPTVYSVIGGVNNGEQRKDTDAGRGVPATDTTA